MNKLINKIQRFLKQNLPFFMSNQSPPALKKIWRQSLFNASKKYWLIYLYHSSLWRINKTVKIIRQSKNKNVKKNLWRNKILRLIWIDNIPPYYFYFHNISFSSHAET